MHTSSFTRRLVSGSLLVLLFMNPAVAEPPNDKKDAAVAAEPAPSVNGESREENSSSNATQQDAAAPAKPCPCASEYAAAVLEFNKRTGDPLAKWIGCEVAVSGTDGLIGYAAKADPQPPGWFTVILVSKGRWGYGHGIQRRCEAWSYGGLAGDWGRPPLGEPTHGGRGRISEEEILACSRLIRETAKCPE